MRFWFQLPAGIKLVERLEFCRYASISNKDVVKYPCHPQMASAYTPEMMPYTNYTFDFKGIIDYIFYPR